MNRRTQRVTFNHPAGYSLCGILDLPPNEPVAYGMFSHCFTCTKDLKAIVRISRRLAEQGIGMLRFDFTGLGGSQGEFSDTNFDTNCQDVMAAHDFLATQFRPPQLLMGHSLGGAAMVQVAPQIGSARALVTIASPSSTEHLAEYLDRTNPDIREEGEGEVTIGGRSYRLKKQLLDNLLKQDLPSALRKLTIPHLIFHPTEDETLPYWHAEKMYEWTGGPKSMITLDRSDHLLVDQPGDTDFVADLARRWFARYQAV